jgi:hypothetical protein
MCDIPKTPFLSLHFCIANIKDPRFQILKFLVARKVERFFFVFFPIINVVFLFYAANKILKLVSSLSAFYVLALLFEKSTQLRFN